MSEKDSTVTTLDDAPAQTKTRARATPVAATPSTNTDTAPETSGQMVTLVIHRSHGDGGSDAVFLSHNSFARQVPRDTPCVVPMEVAQIVADAKEISYQRGPGGAVVEISTPRFAYSITPA